MGAKEDDDTAKTGLRLLHRYFREHPTRGPEGHSYVSSTPRATPTAPGLPYNAAVADLIDASLREVAEHAREVNPEAGPLPEVVEDAYDWYLNNIQNADDMQRQRGEVILYRQQLEHAIAMGDTSVIPRHRCPACRTFGLLWHAPARRALCTNRRCLTRDGQSRTWSLSKLAYEHVAAQKSVRVHAT